MEVNEVNEAFEEYVDALGSYLEHNGFSDDEIDAYFLEHYGKKGMKWGVRRGRGKTGVSRTRGAALDRNERYMRLLRQASAGERYRVSGAVGRAIVGEERFQARLQTRISELSSQNDRIRAGRVTIEDRLDMGLRVSGSGLIISRRPSDSAPPTRRGNTNE